MSTLTAIKSNDPIAKRLQTYAELKIGEFNRSLEKNGVQIPQVEFDVLVTDEPGQPTQYTISTNADIGPAVHLSMKLAQTLQRNGKILDTLPGNTLEYVRPASNLQPISQDFPVVQLTLGNRSQEQMIAALDAVIRQEQLGKDLEDNREAGEKALESRAARLFNERKAKAPQIGSYKAIGEITKFVKSYVGEKAEVSINRTGPGNYAGQPTSKITITVNGLEDSSAFDRLVKAVAEKTHDGGGKDKIQSRIIGEGSVDITKGDFMIMVKGDLNTLAAELNGTMPRVVDGMSR